MTDQKSRSALYLFLGLTILFCALPWGLIIHAGDIGAADLGYVYVMMWGPGLAALATVKLKKLDIRVLGLGWGDSKFALLGYGIPILYAFVAYLVIWGTGLGGFPNEESIKAIAEQLGWSITNPAIFVPLFFFFNGTTGMLIAIAAGLGEEIGWRGFLAPLLVRKMGYTRAGIMGGLIWAAWHFPLILFVNYNNSGVPIWYALICFMLLAIGATFIMQWLRLESGSAWPAAIMHGSHNLFIQGFFTPLTISYGAVTAYSFDEFGFAVPVALWVVTIYTWTKRGHALAAMQQRIEQTGNP